MTRILLLGPCNPNLIPSIHTVDIAELRADKDLQQLHSELLAREHAPQWILGCEDTAVTLWLTAARVFPQAELIRFNSATSQWINVLTQAAWELTEPDDAQPAAAWPQAVERESIETETTPPLAASPIAPIGGSQEGGGSISTTAQTAEPPIAQLSPPPAEKSASSAQGIGEKPDHQILADAFKFAAWGESTHKRELDELRNQAQQRSHELALNLEKRIRRGVHAHSLGLKLEEKLNQSGLTDEIKDWMLKQSNKDALIEKHLNIKFEKWAEYAQKRIARFNANKEAKKAELPPVFAPIQVKNGHHPNSLAYLAPAARWRVIIDESGAHFGSLLDEDTQGINAKLGLLTALVIPEGVKLPTIPSGFHATEKPSRDVDEVVASILKAKVGVFGFRVNDPAARAGNWIGHVESLIRWVLIQLPTEEGKNLNVDCLIEQRGSYATNKNLDVVAEILEGELKQRDPQRFGGLRLRFALTDKAEPDNGYVDAIAFTWGSPSKESKQRLKATAWMDYCLLSPDKAAFERLLLALSHEEQLSPPQWYELSEEAAHAPSGSSIARMLEKLSLSIQEQPLVWESLLDELRYRLRIKQFTLKTMAWALTWLEHCKPSQEAFPPRMQLMLETANLATENHQGKIEPVRIQNILSLANMLQNEAPDEACEAVLRGAVATTNNFEFDLLKPEIERWLSQPVGIAGLLNYGKLQSTLGQILAFTNQPNESLKLFAVAISSFSQLSEPAQALREVQQTTTYQIMAQMDAADVDSQKLQDDLQLFLGTITRKNSLLQISRTMSTAGDGWRFPHHLWLRALIQFPESFRDERAAYLEKKADWQDGDAHPWPLIQAYRGWMLQNSGKHDEASASFNEAIYLCRNEEYGLTLRWMAQVICVTALKLGVQIDEKINPLEQNELKRLLPMAPHQHLAAFIDHDSCRDEQIIKHLQRCLPFNFH